MKRKLLRCMTAVATMLFATSCTSELALEGVPQSGVDGEEVEVTFSVSAQSANAAMRNATEDDNTTKAGGPGQWQKYIGRGQNIDMLIYAVYDNNNTLLKQYGASEIPIELEGCAALQDYSLEEGQTIIKVNNDFHNGIPETIRLRLMRNKTYHIAFWAQSSQTTAFDTKNLEKVQVKYENAANNDELRDAFCKVETFSVSANENSRTVVLTRPMAQINVGTTGADYEWVKEKKEKIYTQSKIKLDGVAQYFNVVADSVYENTQDLTTVIYEFSKIPAYIKTDIPDDLIKNAEEEEPEQAAVESTDDKEFLIVDLNNDGQIKKYTTVYPTLDKDGVANTEIFEYLSMCYVLVPATKIVAPKDGEDDTQSPKPSGSDTGANVTYNSSTLSSVEVSFAETDGNGNAINSRTPITINTIPVHRNWRTNILCGLYKDTPKDEEDDPTSIYKNPKCTVSIESLFDGEYNSTDEGEGWNEDIYGDNKPSGDTPEE